MIIGTYILTISILCLIIVLLKYFSWLVRLGDVNLNSDKDDFAVAVMEIDTIKTHPRYIFRQSNFDVAVLELKGKVDLRTSISPVCLPTVPLSSTEDGIDEHAGRLVRLIGWGFLALNNPNTDGELKCARLEVYTQQ